MSDASRRGPQHPSTQRMNRELNDATLTMEQYKAQKQREQMERRARQFMRDMEYRKALGLDLHVDLPKALGSSGGTRRASYTNIVGTKRMTA